MDILEITETETFAVYFRQLSANTRSMPSMLMLLASSKVLLILTFNFSVIYALCVASWRVCVESSKNVFVVHVSKKKNKRHSPVMSIKSIRSNATTVVMDTPQLQQQPQQEQKSEVVTTTTQTDTYKPTAITSENDDNSRRTSVNSSISELRLPRVPYEKSTLDYYPTYNTYERNSKTHF